MVDLILGVGLLAVAMSQMFHAYSHLHDAKGARAVMEARHTEERLLYEALDAFFRGKGTYPERDAKVRAALAQYEANHIDGVWRKS